MKHKRVTLVGPTLLIGIGAILLLSNLGVIHWDLWDVLRLWPVLLVAAGLEVLFGDRTIWGSLLAAFLLAIFIGGAIWISGGTAPGGPARETMIVSYDRDGAEAATIDLRPVIADVIVGPLVDTPRLLEGQVMLLRREELRRAYTNDGTARLSLISEGLRSYGPASLGATSTWDVGINADVDLRLSIDMAVGRIDLDLRDLQLSEGTVDFGVGQIDIRLPEQSSASVVLDGGIGVIVLEVPQSVGVRLTSDSGLVIHNVPADYAQTGNTYTSPGFSEANHRIDILTSLGIGTITVQNGSD